MKEYIVHYVLQGKTYSTDHPADTINIAFIPGESPQVTDGINDLLEALHRAKLQVERLHKFTTVYYIKVELINGKS